MKIHWLSKRLPIALSALALLVCTTGIQAQTSPSDHGYLAAERGHEYTVWSKWVWQTNQGIATVESNTLVQVASGLNRWQSNQWVPAAPELVVTNGGVLGRGAQAAAFFSGNLNSIAATRVLMPDGQWLKTHIVGLAYHDASSNTNLLVAAPKDCAPQIVGTNRVAYLDAFDDLRCDVVYSYTALGVRQDIVLRENPGDPAILYGLNAQFTYLLVISEVDEGPAPQITERAWPAGEDMLVDQTLNFGSMSMVPGRAFRVEHTSGDVCGLLVAKRLETVAGRRFIVERVRYERIEPDLRTLPTSATPLTNAPGITLTNGSVRKPTRWYASGALPPARTSVSGISGRPLKVANVDNRPGVVLDWNLALNPTDFAFTCGNYLISGETRLADVVFSPNAVLKYDPGASLHVDGALTWLEDPDCGDAPALLTSANDDEHGVVLDWSTHSPVRGNYGPALVVRAQDLPLARLHITNRFGAPGIIAERPAPSSVTIIALKPAARRRAGDSAAVAVRRVDGDWSQPLTVPFTVSGSAVLGQDYQPIGTNVTIPAGEGGTILPVFPTATAEAQPLATVTVALQPDPQEGTELARDTVRISSTPADPGLGRLVFVNPSSSSPAPPYDNFVENAAHTIADAVAQMQADDNILIAAASPYSEKGMNVPVGGTIAGLAGSWRATDPSTATYPLSDSFDFSGLPIAKNTAAGFPSPLFHADAPAPSPDGQIQIAGLHFANCSCLTAFGGQSGSVVNLMNIDIRLAATIAYCRFASNSAAVYGGAIFLSNVDDANVQACEFERNQVRYVTSANNDYTGGMGGAIASIGSSLNIQHCSFLNDLAETISGYDATTGEPMAPPLGSAGGGGDVYSKNGQLELTQARSLNAVAGFPMLLEDHTPQEFTGDGGAVLVHGQQSGTTFNVSDSEFQSSASYGNGGAVSVSYDSSPEGRQYFVGPWNPPFSPEPTQLGGQCSGTLSGVLFESCSGGWQGGAASLNGRGVQMIFDKFFDDSPLNGGAGWGAATVYQQHGTLTCADPSVSVQANAAARWGGGVYVGISPPWYGDENYDSARVQINRSSIVNNSALLMGNGTPLLPSQISTERVGDNYGWLPALLDFSQTSISGNANTDIGIYCWYSVTAVVDYVLWGSLAAQVIGRP